jgi:phage terminase Nu1 subunit (DNA packaging protein)
MATAIQAGKHVFLGVSRFNVLVGEGVFRRMPVGKYDLDTVREEYCRHAQKMMAGRGEDGGKSLSAQRAKLAAAQAKAAEHKNAVMEGEYIPVAAYENYMKKMFTVMREIALSTPGKTAHSLQPHTPLDREKIFEIVRAEIYEMLNSLSDPATITAAVASLIANRKKESA